MALKKISLIMLTVVIAFLISGCNLKQKISESITEEIIENAAGDEVDVDIDGDNISYDTEDGEVTIDEDTGMTYEGEDGTVIASGSEYEWPSDQAAAYLPKLDTGAVSYILNGPDSCMLIVDGLVLEDYQSYEKAIVNAGYTNDQVESSAEDMEIYSGTSSDGIIITLSFIPSEGSIQITVDASGKQ